MPYSPRAYYMFFLGLLLATILAVKLRQVYLLGESTLETGNVVSEENSLLAARDWTVKGFWRHFGLPKYSDRSSGPWGDSRLDVYTHYPPGSEWVAYAMSRLCTLENVACIRLAPLLLGLSALGLLLFSLSHVFTLGQTIFMCVSLMAVPMTTHMMEGLGYEGYAFSLFALQLAFLLFTFSEPSMRRQRYYVLPLFIVCFLNGWFSFDYIALVVTAPVLLGLLMAISRKRLLEAFFVSAAGFVFANFLHFGQVALFYGSIQTALSDFYDSGTYRCCGPLESTPWSQIGPLSSFRILNDHLTINAQAPYLFKVNLQLLFAAGLVCLSWTGPVRLRLFNGWEMAWRPLPRFPMVFIFSFLTSCAWTLIFKQHSAAHIFTSRHFFFAYFMLMATVAKSTTIHRVS